MRIFENKVLKRIFGPKRNGVTGEWRRLPSLELNAAYSSPNIFRVIKSRRMCWVGHVCFGGDREKNLGVNWKIILKWFFEKWDVETWTELFWLRIWTGVGRL